MKLPYPKHLDVTPIQVSVCSGIDKNGVPNLLGEYSGKCRLIEKAQFAVDKDGKRIRLECAAYIGCDIFPEARVIEGSVTLRGIEYKIFRASRPRNPDGSVHHTKLELI